MDPMPPDSPYSAPPPLPSSVYPAPPPGSGGFAAGDLLKQTFSIYGANFVAFTVIAALVSLPAILCTAFLGMKPIGLWLGILFGFLVGPIGTGAITYGVFEHLRGQPKSVGEALSVGLSKALSVLGVSLLVGLCVIVGFVFCIIPGIYVSIVLALAVPVAIQEKLSGTEALRRSSSLTEGHRGDIFVVLFAIGLIGLALSFGLGIVFGLGGGGAHPELVRLLAQILSLPVGALSGTAAAVMYYRLRNVKESFDLHSVASVFD